ncbi:amidohydrolase [Fulvivirga lutea]|uniref:Amidohydrolase n=1 Tax=Fulvivirga lutea TaxID=2810512 RepID=A0A974WL02_9BACT|nr:amidohydrolase [Fulvivirga lutea]QSE98120.1 amidohydrolase [Fulvivirga lutea]
MKYLIILLLFIPFSLSAQNDLNSKAIEMAKSAEPKMVEWRRHFHQNPELSNREVNTSKKIAAELKAMGIEVQTGIAKTGVVGILKGGKPGPVVALRADIDALPITERTGLPFASEVTTEFNGNNTGVMHACGHDMHMTIVLAAAKILSEMRKDLPGTVKFIFQPAEEGPPPGEEGGASLMVKEGVLKNPDVEAIFGLHIDAGSYTGQISYKSEGIMAASDRFEINIKGKQSHGSKPWSSVDPISVAAQIINSLQYIVSRNVELTKEAAVISVGIVQAGVRFNIIPEEAKIVGTIRTLDKPTQKMIWEKIESTAKNIAEIAGATAEVQIESNALLTYNDPELMAKMLPSLAKSTKPELLYNTKAITPAEDFSYFQEEIPGLYFFVGAGGDNPSGGLIDGHHTPEFNPEEAAMLTGLKAMLNLTLDYMQMEQ